jgi:AraC-like DNA-binding protein
MHGRHQVDTRYFAQLVGADRAGELLCRTGLVPPGGPLPETIDMIDFWRCCAQNILLMDDESHGIAAQKVPRGSLSVLVSAAKEADDLGGALRRLVEAAHWVRRDCHMALSRGRGVLRFTIHGAGEDAEPSLRAEIYAECFATVIHCALRWMAGRRLDPVKVRGGALLRGMDGTLLDALGAPLERRGGGVAIDYALADMALPVLSQKYTAWGEAEFASFVAMLGEEEHEAPDAILAETWAQFERGHFAQDQVAAALGMSLATLRRRLAASGPGFRDLSARYRVARLRDLLATDMAMGDIAERLGLSDERSLRRFCTLHLGAPPARLRHARS